MIPDSPGWAGGRGPLRILPPLLFEARRPALQIIVAWLMSLAGSVLLGWLAAHLFPDAARPDFGNADSSVVFAAIVLFSPVVETILMALALKVLLGFLRPWQAAIASAALWGVLHSLSAPTWGVVVWWPFLLFSTVFLTWRHRGFWLACGIVMLIHLLQNIGPAAAIVMNR